MSDCLVIGGIGVHWKSLISQETREDWMDDALSRTSATVDVGYSLFEVFCGNRSSESNRSIVRAK
jgi:hypothetical protein